MTTHSSSASASASAAWQPRMWALLLVLAGNMLIDALEVSVVLVALPAIAADLGLSMWTVQWVMGGFALGFAATLLLGPRITARWGRRRVYLAALLVFAAASVAGGLTDSAALLIATRFVKGVCAALTAPAGLAIISTAFPDGPPQRRAVSVYALFGGIGFTTGLLLSGILTGADWHLVFLFPAPVALLLFAMGARLVPPDPGRPEAHRLRPALLAERTLLRSALGAATLNGSYLGLLLLLSFQLQQRPGWGPLQTALAFLPACLPVAVTAPFAGRMVARFGTARPIALGALAPAAGYLLLLRDPEPGTYLTGVLPTLLLVGAGFVFAFAPLNMQATSGLPAGSRAQAVPLYQTGVQLGAVLTLSQVALLLGDDGDAYRPALVLITAVGAAGLLVALTGLRKGSRGSGPGRATT
ncbi:MFS transporter [Streptomyces sp. YIM 98790]|uniref:MFS transporter n=1 Tax=Streptomyces sp. YIM 98790 TaxID=2689077 RepID=UPI00140A6450|nr:MFS transporter [Streptomyces sp. YIM 98790]